MVTNFFFRVLLPADEVDRSRELIDKLAQQIGVSAEVSTKPMRNGAMQFVSLRGEVSEVDRFRSAFHSTTGSTLEPAKYSKPGVQAPQLVVTTMDYAGTSQAESLGSDLVTGCSNKVIRALRLLERVTPHSPQSDRLALVALMEQLTLGSFAADKERAFAQKALDIGRSLLSEVSEQQGNELRRCLQVIERAFGLIAPPQPPA